MMILKLIHLNKKIYLISGKFSVDQDGSINVSIITNVHIPLDKEDIPIMKPTVHLLGKTVNCAQLSEAGYTLQIQVKPYLSKEQFKPFSINLTHPLNGRFKNALTMAKKNSTIHITGLFFFADSQLCCEILEFQFITSKMQTENAISVPWKTNVDSHTIESSSSLSKSPIEKRIDLVRQSLAAQASSPTDSPKQNCKNKRKATNIKISEISKSLQNQIEIHDSDQEKIDDDIEVIEDNEETVDDEDGDVQTKNTTVTRRSKKRRSNKR